MVFSAAMKKIFQGDSSSFQSNFITSEPGSMIFNCFADLIYRFASFTERGDAVYKQKTDSTNRNSFLGTFEQGGALRFSLKCQTLTKILVSGSLLATHIAIAASNPAAIAELRWYSANQAASFNLADVPHPGPQFLAFDGASIWVSNYGFPCQGCGNTVTKLRASDGMILGTFVVGTGPAGIAFDGANIWVANYGSNDVTKLRASDGAVLGTFRVEVNPYAVAFDGTNVWVTNATSNTVSKLRATNGAILGTFPVGNYPGGLAFDGVSMWVVNAHDNEVMKLRISDGSVLGTFAVGAAFDGANIWVANSASYTLSKK
jgi:hypothetical protein